jgi:hypothetical protein
MASLLRASVFFPSYCRLHPVFHVGLLKPFKSVPARPDMAVQPGLADEVYFAPGSLWRSRLFLITSLNVKRVDVRVCSIRFNGSINLILRANWRRRLKALLAWLMSIGLKLGRASLVQSDLCVNEVGVSLSGGGCGVQGTHPVLVLSGFSGQLVLWILSDCFWTETYGADGRCGRWHFYSTQFPPGANATCRQQRILCTH